jgi:hypothetical protein
MIKFGRFIFATCNADLDLLKKGDYVISTNSFAHDALYKVRHDGKLPLIGTQKFQLDEHHPIYQSIG